MSINWKQFKLIYSLAYIFPQNIVCYVCTHESSTSSLSFRFLYRTIICVLSARVMNVWLEKSDFMPQHIKQNSWGKKWGQCPSIFQFYDCLLKRNRMKLKLDEHNLSLLYPIGWKLFTAENAVRVTAPTFSLARWIWSKLQKLDSLSSGSALNDTRLPSFCFWIAVWFICCARLILVSLFLLLSHFNLKICRIFLSFTAAGCHTVLGGQYDYGIHGRVDNSENKESNSPLQFIYDTWMSWGGDKIAQQI